MHNGVMGSSGRITSGQPKKVPSNDDLQTSEFDNSFNINIEGNTISPSGVQPKPTTTLGMKKHVSEMLNYEADAYGIPDKWDSLDEYLNADSLVIAKDEGR